MSSRVSVIVPCYNAARFLPACLDSLLAQTLEGLEIIAIDDASTDGSAQILRQYAQKHARINVYTFPQNRGVSAARNQGISMAQGEYIGFCDADDWAEPEMFVQLLAAAQGGDLSFCPVVKDYEGGNAVQVPLPWAGGTRFDAATIRSVLIPEMIAKDHDTDELPVSGYTPRNLFRRTLLEGLTFREDIHYAEDLLFIISAMLRASDIGVCGSYLYHYRFYGGSVTKRYSKHVPAAYEQCHSALESLFASEGLDLSARMSIRRRKSAMDAVKNFCLPGTPYSPMNRVKQISAYLDRDDIRKLYARLDLSALSGRFRLKYAMMKGRKSFLLMLLFSYVFKNR